METCFDITTSVITFKVTESTIFKEKKMKVKILPSKGSVPLSSRVTFSIMTECHHNNDYESCLPVSARLCLCRWISMVKIRVSPLLSPKLNSTVIANRQTRKRPTETYPNYWKEKSTLENETQYWGYSSSENSYRLKVKLLTTKRLKEYSKVVTIMSDTMSDMHSTRYWYRVWYTWSQNEWQDGRYACIWTPIIAL